MIVAAYYAHISFIATKCATQKRFVDHQKLDTAILSPPFGQSITRTARIDTTRLSSGMAVDFFWHSLPKKRNLT